MNDFQLLFKTLQIIMTRRKTVEPEETARIGQANIKALFKKLGTTNVYVSDDFKKRLTRSDVEKFLASTAVDHNRYIAETYDCDDFTYSLMGLAASMLSGYAFGFVWADTPVGKHALNCFIDDYNQIWYVEPQTDRIFQDYGYKPYLVVM